MMATRPMPHSLEAERNVLGAVLLRNAAIWEIPQLEPAHFWREAHREIWRAMRALAEAGTAIDATTLGDALERAGTLADVGGPAYLSGLVDGLPRSTNVAHYARIVVERWQLRQIAQAARRMLADALGGEEEPAVILETAQRTILALHEGRPDRRGPVRASDGVSEIAPAVEAMLAGQPMLGMPTGFVDLDWQTRGMAPGELVILGGRPSMGKTSFALNVAAHVASRGQTVLFFSLEMPRSQLLLRQIASLARVDFHRWLSGLVRSEADMRRVGEAMARVSTWPLWIDDEARRLSDIAAVARRVRTQADLALVIVDYLQLIPSDGENRNLELGAISSGLKALAKECHVPIVALSQLSREVARRTDHRPTLADLRDSGALEQDADQVWFTHRPEVYEPDKAELHGRAELIVAKARNGPTGIVPLLWRPELMRFESQARREDG